MTKYVGILGTHGWPDDSRREWWHPESAFAAFLSTHGFTPARPDRPFVWSGDLDGVPFFASGKDWEAGAQALFYYLEDLPYRDRNLIAHSHGGNVALLAALEISIRSLVMIGTPVRKDIERIASDAVLNIDRGRCLHISDSRFDLWGSAGAFLDFRVSLRRRFKVGGIVTDQVPGIGHAGVLRDPERFPMWERRGWLAYLSAVEVVQTSAQPVPPTAAV